MVHNLILSMEERIAALEARDILTESQRQSFIRISKMQKTMCCKFKAYDYDIMASLETDEAAREEQVFFDEDRNKKMEFADRLGNLQAVPQLSIPS